MKISFYSLIIIFCLNITFVFSQTGSISGTIRSKSSKETLVGANVIIENSSIGATTNIDGSYKIEHLKKGTYNISISYISYKKIILKNVIVNENKNTLLDVYLEDEYTELQTVNVTGVRKTDTELSMISTIKNNNLISTGVSAQQISKTQDRDATEVIKRVSGVTISDNRFVMVRGLSERYNAVWLNNFATPSSESDVKAFSFDMIPSSLIDRLQVYKTPAPELPGDFAGGAILIFTKNDFEKDYFNCRYSSSLRSGTSFSEFKTNQIGRYSWLGTDDGSRNINDYATKEVSPNNLNKSTENKLNQQWNTNVTTAIPDQRFSMALAKKITMGKYKINTLNAINYGQTYNTDIINRNYFLTFDQIKNESDTSWSYQDKQYTYAVRIAIMSNWIFNINSKNKLEIRNFINHYGYNRTNIRNGMDFDNLQSNLRAFQYSFMERSIYSGQISGKHSLTSNDFTTIDWGIGYALANRNEPDIKRLTQVLNNSNPESDHFNQYYTILSSIADPRYAGRLFLKTDENIYNFNVQIKQQILKNNSKAYIKIGTLAERKQRDFSARLFGYTTAINCPWTIIYQPIDSIFSATNLNNSNGLILREKTNPSDSYDSENDLIAGYIAFNIPLTNKINIYSGLRIEKNKQILNSFSSDYNKVPINVDNDVIQIFPSINLAYNINEKKLFRLAYGITVNRPEFRELAPFAFYDFDLGATIRGNENLTNASIHNCDLRYEFYPTLSEVIIIGAFGKYFVNPIESVLTPSGSDVNYSFKNAEFSTSYGVELEAKKTFNFTSNKNIIQFINNCGVMLNSSLIKSNVFFEPKFEKIGERPMQGQSPYILNTGIFYQNDTTGTQFSLLYNVMGKRIAYVGDGNTPDVYELPKNNIDFSFTQRLNKYIKINASIQDILNQPNEFCQFVGKNNTQKQTTFSLRKGTYYTLGFVFSI